MSRSKIYGKNRSYMTGFCSTLPKPKALHFFLAKETIRRDQSGKDQLATGSRIPPMETPFIFPGFKVHQNAILCSSRAMLGSWFYPTILPTKNATKKCWCLVVVQKKSVLLWKHILTGQGIHLHALFLSLSS